MQKAAVFLLSLSLLGTAGCAAAFRSGKETVHVDSKPTGAEVKRGETSVGSTPGNFEFDRGKTTQLKLSKQGYEDHYITPKKSANPGWIVLDVLTCIVPVALCIPIIVDAVTGAWNDIDKSYTAEMKPGTGSPASSASAATSATPPASASAAPAGGPPIDMSESERKATARAAYMEGIKLQDAGQCPEAIPRFETAQKFFAAPTHLLHLGQCQAATGKLVEASETYETLARVALAKDAPDAFRQAQEDGKAELSKIRPRIPTLKIQLTPDAKTLSSLVVKLNGNAIPNEVVGLARPVNPGLYTVTVWAAGYKEASAKVEVGEGTAKAADIKLTK